MKQSSLELKLSTKKTRKQELLAHPSSTPNAVSA